MAAIVKAFLKKKLVAANPLFLGENNPDQRTLVRRQYRLYDQHEFRLRAGAFLSFNDTLSIRTAIMFGDVLRNLSRVNRHEALICHSASAA